MAERPTPHSIAICTLIALHSDPSSILKQKNQSDSREVDNHLFQLIQHLVLTNAEGWVSNSPLSTTSSSYETTPLSSLLDMIGGSVDNASRRRKNYGSKSRKARQRPPYYHAAKILLDDLIQSSMSIDSLMDLFTALRSTIDKGIVDSDSSHGVYVRKRCLGWNQLSFESVGRLWESFQQYVASASNWGDQTSKASNRQMNDMTNSNQRDGEDTGPLSGLDGSYEHSTLSEKENIQSSLWPMHPRQISVHLRNQCDALHQQNDSISHHSFASVEAQMQDILDSDPELTMAHFLRMLNCIRVGERVGAMENFHRYFDYAMIQERKDRLLWGNATAEGTQSGDEASAAPKIRRNVVQYAAIVLASIYHSFCNDDLANAATEEAVRVAQESGDGACLAYALGWLHTTSDEGNGNNLVAGGDLLSRATTRAAEYNLRSLLAGTSLLQASHSISGLGAGERIPGSNETSFAPTNAWERIAAASAEGRSSAASGSGIISSLPLHDTPTYMTNFNGSADVMEIFAQQQITSSGLWRSMGNTSQSSFTSQIAMHNYQNFLTRDQYAYAAQDIASSILYGNNFDTCLDGVDTKTKSLSSTLEQLTMNNRKDSITNSNNTNTALNGNAIVYKTALEKLSELKAVRMNAVNSSWRHQEALINHEWSLRRYDVDILSSNTLLHSLIPLTKRDGIKAFVETMGQHSLLLCRFRDWEGAKQLILDRICPLCERYHFNHLHAHYLLQVALIHLECNSDNAISALPFIFECLSLCERLSIDSIHSSALVILARTQFELDNTRRARATLEGSMSAVLQHSHLWFHGEAWLTMAKCSIIDAKDIKESDRVDLNRKKMEMKLKKALSHLSESRIAFEKIEDVQRLREVYYLEAQTYNAFEDQVLNRNRAAKKFKEMNSVMVQSVTPSWLDAI